MCIKIMFLFWDLIFKLRKSFYNYKPRSQSNLKWNSTGSVLKSDFSIPSFFIFQIKFYFSDSWRPIVLSQKRITPLLDTVIGPDRDWNKYFTPFSCFGMVLSMELNNDFNEYFRQMFSDLSYPCWFLNKKHWCGQIWLLLAPI